MAAVKHFRDLICEQADFRLIEWFGNKFQNTKRRASAIVSINLGGVPSWRTP